MGKINVRVALNMDRLPLFFLYFNEFLFCYVLHFTFYIFRLPLTPGETVWLQVEWRCDYHIWDIWKG